MRKRTTRSSIPQLIVEIQHVLDEIDAHAPATRPWYHRRIEQLTELLARLVALLQVQRPADPHVVPLEELRGRIDHCMTAGDDRDVFMQDVARLKALDARLRTVLASVDALPTPPPSRDRFWA